MSIQKYIASLFILLIVQQSHAQSINWNDADTSRPVLIFGKFGVEYGVCYSLGGGYLTQLLGFPILLNASISLPVGETPFDDKKTKLGATIKWYSYKGFTVSTDIHGVYRSYENTYVHLDNFGSDLSATVGYYASHWFFAGQVGFDKAIATKYEHTPVYQSIYPEVVNGWYEPASGGNFYYGLGAGATFYHYTIGMRAGKILNENFYAGPMLPFYGELQVHLLF
ncbi:MAG TPA: hypothetical protein PKL06_04385 [Chitinophagales bacterium]|nr:hypothetical protein [Chitinophagales bacterium]